MEPPQARVRGAASTFRTGSQRSGRLRRVVAAPATAGVTCHAWLINREPDIYRALAGKHPYRKTSKRHSRRRKVEGPCNRVCENTKSNQRKAASAMVSAGNRDEEEWINVLNVVFRMRLSSPRSFDL